MFLFRPELHTRGPVAEQLDDVQSHYYRNEFRRVLVESGLSRTEPVPEHADTEPDAILHYPYSRAISAVLARIEPVATDYLD